MTLGDVQAISFDYGSAVAAQSVPQTNCAVMLTNPFSEEDYRFNLQTVRTISAREHWAPAVLYGELVLATDPPATVYQYKGIFERRLVGQGTAAEFHLRVTMTCPSCSGGTKAEMDRLIKALSHAARLCGAHLGSTPF